MSTDAKHPIPLVDIDEKVGEEQIKRLKDVRRRRDNRAAKKSLDDIKNACKKGENVMPYCIEAVKNLGYPAGNMRRVSRSLWRVSRPGTLLIMTLADNEAQASETKCSEACRSNYPRSKATWDWKHKMESIAIAKRIGID